MNFIIGFGLFCISLCIVSLIRQNEILDNQRWYEHSYNARFGPGGMFVCVFMACDVSVNHHRMINFIYDALVFVSKKENDIIHQRFKL